MSHLSFLSVSTTSIFSVTLFRRLGALLLACLLSNFTASTDHPPSSSLCPPRSDSFLHSLDLTANSPQIGLPSSSSAACQNDLFKNAATSMPFSLPQMQWIPTAHHINYKLLSLAFRPPMRSLKLAFNSLSPLQLLHNPATSGFPLSPKCLQNCHLGNLCLYRLIRVKYPFFTMVSCNNHPLSSNITFSNYLFWSPSNGYEHFSIESLQYFTDVSIGSVPQHILLCMTTLYGVPNPFTRLGAPWGTRSFSFAWIY